MVSLVLEKTEDCTVFGDVFCRGRDQFVECDFGAMANGYGNMCLYLHLSNGNEDQAVILKQQLAPDAIELYKSENQHSSPPSYGDPNVLGDDYVIKAFVALKNISVYTWSSTSNRFHCYYTEQSSSGPIVYLWNNFVHFKLLIPVNHETRHLLNLAHMQRERHQQELQEQEQEQERFARQLQDDARIAQELQRQEQNDQRIAQELQQQENNHVIA